MKIEKSVKKSHRLERSDLRLFVIRGGVIYRHASPLPFESKVFHQWHSMKGAIAVTEK